VLQFGHIDPIFTLGNGAQHGGKFGPEVKNEIARQRPCNMR